MAIGERLGILFFKLGQRLAPGIDPAALKVRTRVDFILEGVSKQDAQTLFDFDEIVFSVHDERAIVTEGWEEDRKLALISAVKRLSEYEPVITNIDGKEAIIIESIMQNGVFSRVAPAVAELIMGKSLWHASAQGENKLAFDVSQLGERQKRILFNALSHSKAFPEWSADKSEIIIDDSDSMARIRTADIYREPL